MENGDLSCSDLSIATFQAKNMAAPLNPTFVPMLYLTHFGSSSGGSVSVLIYAVLLFFFLCVVTVIISVQIAYRVCVFLMKLAISWSLEVICHRPPHTSLIGSASPSH